MCINSRAEIFALSVMCAVFDVAYILIHAMNFVYYKKHGTYIAVYSMALITAILVFISAISRRARPLEVGVFLCKGKIAVTAMEVGYLGYRIALGYYDLPLHFFKQYNNRNSVPVAAAAHYFFSKRPRSNREWRKFYHVSYISMEACLLIVDVYTTWRLDLYMDKVVSRRQFF
ncbi:uncharacterized protein LOC142764796 [Rhipicephalus microplus]|uniref:uncharacterized protein LOC142764796 n=1 Tax=Rhipicephalus microplus TaxID=6941 RepID=UPI003F6B5F1D